MSRKVSKIEPAPPLGRRQRKAIAVRRALFDAGLSAFDRQPIGLVSVLDITEAADVAKGVFYLQFRSKDDYLLALWEDVQNRVLDSARVAVTDCSSSSVRTEAVIGALLEFARTSPAAARFWLRMSSFFPDEIGEPGHLARIREVYIQQLAAAISGRIPEKLTARDLLASQLVDMVGWAAINSHLQHGESLISPAQLVRALQAAM